jgi:hypothetical protein
LSKLSQALAKLAPTELAKRLQGTRLDAWVNQVTGFGTTRDKTTYSRFTRFTILADQELSDLYHGDAMAARIVDVVPQEMLRKPFDVDCEDQKANDWLREKLEALRARQNLLDGYRWGRTYGGAVVIIGADDGRPASKPLLPERVKAVRYLYIADRRFISPLTYYSTPGDPKLGEVETYLVTPANAMALQSTEVIHESRLLVFGGAPTGAREKAELGGWDYSILQRCNEVLLQHNTGWKAVEVMLTDAYQAVFKTNGLAAAIAAETGDPSTSAASLLQKRMQLIDMSRSVIRAIVVDAGSAAEGENPEEFIRQSVSFEQIPQTLDKLMLRLASTAPMPVTILMGQSPAGMNATGDSDFRWFYDHIASEQENDLGPLVRRLTKLLLASQENPTSLKAPKKIEVKFQPLWQLDPLQEAQRQSSLATADKAYVDSQVFLPEEVALARGEPGGLDKPIEISDDARKAREEVIKNDLDKMQEEPEPPEPTTPE